MSCKKCNIDNVKLYYCYNCNVLLCLKCLLLHINNRMTDFPIRCQKTI